MIALISKTKKTFNDFIKSHKIDKTLVNYYKNFLSVEAGKYSGIFDIDNNEEHIEALKALNWYDEVIEAEPQKEDTVELDEAKVQQYNQFMEDHLNTLKVFTVLNNYAEMMFFLLHNSEHVKVKSILGKNWDELKRKFYKSWKEISNVISNTNRNSYSAEVNSIIKCKLYTDLAIHDGEVSKSKAVTPRIATSFLPNLCYVCSLEDKTVHIDKDEITVQINKLKETGEFYIDAKDKWVKITDLEVGLIYQFFDAVVQALLAKEVA